MKTGFRGTFVIPWTLTEVDGLRDAPGAALRVGASWRRIGDALRLDGPADLLLLDGADGEADTRRRAAKAVQRLVGAALQPGQFPHHDASEPLLDRGFVLTDGARCYTATEITTGGGRPPLLMFQGEMPPLGTDLWVVRLISEHLALNRHVEGPKGVICFVSGTMIDTPDGARPVEDLQAGDAVQTSDNGAQKVIWTGYRRMSGARLYAMPELRPIRIRRGALGLDRPDEDLVVSPLHRVLIRGPQAELLFRTPEVLVAAKDLLNDHSIHVDHTMRQVTYHHLLLEDHQVLFANGVETESFHPAQTSLEVIDPVQRDKLLEILPALAHDDQAYGAPARRNLTASEAAVLQHEGVPGQ